MAQNKAVKEFLENFAEVMTLAANPEERDMRLTQFDGFAPTPPSVKVNDDLKGYVQSRQRARPTVTSLLFEALRAFGVQTVYKGRGRPPAPLQDKLFLLVEKVHRGETYDSHYENIDYYALKGYIQRRVDPHSVSRFMLDSQLTPLLRDLATFTSIPLAELEREFAVDATGIGTYGKRWVKVRTEYQRHSEYRKMHTLVGVRTGIITSTRVTYGNRHDSPELIPLLEQMKRYFRVAEVSADAGYTGRENVQAVGNLGATPYFKIKKNMTGRGGMGKYPAWGHMIRKFRQNERLYMQHYAKRSNVEAVYSSFKRAIRDTLAGKRPLAQENEALCVAIVHNLRILVRAMYQHDVMPEFHIIKR